MCDTRLSQICSFSIILTSPHTLNLPFLPIYLGFHLDSLRRHPDSPDSLHSHADSPHPHSHPIPRIPTLILHISLIPFPNSLFWVLQIAYSVCNL